MRITSAIQYGAMQENIAQATAQMYKYQQQVSSGKALSAATDDPVAYARVTQLKQSTTQQEQYSQTIRTVQTSMQSYESNLQNVTRLMNQARSLGLQAANDTIDAQARTQIASQIDSLVSQALQAANANSDGHFIYGGSKDQASPYTAVTDATGKVTGVTYNGDARVASADVGGGAKVKTGVSGADVFGVTPGDPNSVIGSLIALRDQITSGKAQSISDSIQGIDNAMQSVSGTRAQVGVRMQHLGALAQVNQETLTAIKGEQSSLEDTNLPDAMTNLMRMQTTYQAALTVAAKASQQTSLLSKLQ